MTSTNPNELIAAADLTNGNERLMLADAMEEAGRTEEAETLRDAGVICGQTAHAVACYGKIAKVAFHRDNLRSSGLLADDPALANSRLGRQAKVAREAYALFRAGKFRQLNQLAKRSASVDWSWTAIEGDAAKALWTLRIRSVGSDHWIMGWAIRDAVDGRADYAKE